MASKKVRKYKTIKINGRIYRVVEAGNGELRIQPVGAKTERVRTGKAGLQRSANKGKSTPTHSVVLNVKKPALFPDAQPSCIATLKLDAFDANRGIEPQKLLQITDSFESMLKAALEKSGVHATVSVRVSTIQEGCMSIDLPIVIIQTLSINVSVSSIDVVSAILSGLSTYFAYLGFRYTKEQSRLGRRLTNSKLDVWLRNAAIPQMQRKVLESREFLERVLLFLKSASESKRGNVTLTARPTDEQESGEHDQSKLVVTPKDIDRLEKYLKDSEQSEDSDSTES